MNKGNHPFQHDENLREALRQDEAALPQMSADLNDRLMKRLQQEEQKRHVALWPWVAAACVAAVMVVLLLPPRESGDEVKTNSGELAEQNNSLANERDTNDGLQETKDMESKTTTLDYRIINPDSHDRRIANSKERTEQDGRIENPDTRDRRIANSTERTEQDGRIENPDTHDRRIANSTEQTGLENSTELEVTASEEKALADLPPTQAKPQQVVMTERDIPISRPENYRYTPEELALMRKQANEAYVKWMELEMEIMKYQFEQIAKQ